MNAGNLQALFSNAQIEFDRTSHTLNVISEGNRILLYTGSRSVRNSRILAILVGAVLIGAGAIALGMSMWGLSAIIAGVAICIATPYCIRPARLLEIDTDAAVIQVAQSPICEEAAIALSDIRGIHGAYETKGWDGYSVIYATLNVGADTPVLMLPGADETLAQLVCRTLGILTARPATYIGPFGGANTCFSPGEPG